MSSIIDKLFDRTYTGLHKALDLTFRRNEAIASNVANAETPQYRAVDLSFGTELKRAFGEESSTLMQTNSRHQDIGGTHTAHLIPNTSGETKPDGNNVDIDIEMGRLAFNSSRYTSAASSIRKKFALLRYIITDAGR